MRMYRGSICERFLRFKIIGEFDALTLAYVRQPLFNSEDIFLDGRAQGKLNENTFTQVIHDSSHTPFCIRFRREEDAMHFLFTFRTIKISL